MIWITFASLRTALDGLINFCWKNYQAHSGIKKTRLSRSPTRMEVSTKRARRSFIRLFVFFVFSSSQRLSSPLFAVTHFCYQIWAYLKLRNCAIVWVSHLENIRIFCERIILLMLCVLGLWHEWKTSFKSPLITM